MGQHIPKEADTRRTSPPAHLDGCPSRDSSRCPYKPLADSKLHQTEPHSRVKRAKNPLLAMYGEQAPKNSNGHIQASATPPKSLPVPCRGTHTHQASNVSGSTEASDTFMRKASAMFMTWRSRRTTPHRSNKQVDQYRFCTAAPPDCGGLWTLRRSLMPGVFTQDHELPTEAASRRWRGKVM